MVLLSAEHHDLAQTLRAKYTQQLLDLEQYLPADQRTSDAGVVAARLVRAAAEFAATDPTYDGSWLSRFFPPELVAARLQPAAVDPLLDDLLSALGIDTTLGMGVGAPISAGPVTGDDLDAALSTVP